MTNQQKIIDLFKQHGNRLRLGELLQHPFGYEFRARICELKKKGYAFVLQRGDKASDNLYIMIEPGQQQLDLLAPPPPATMRGH